MFILDTEYIKETKNSPNKEKMMVTDTKQHSYRQSSKLTRIATWNVDMIRHPLTKSKA